MSKRWVMFDKETEQALQEIAGRELRTFSMQVVAMVRQVMGLPFPFEQSRADEFPNLLEEKTSRARKSPRQASDLSGPTTRPSKSRRGARKDLTPHEDEFPQEISDD